MVATLSVTVSLVAEPSHDVLQGSNAFVELNTVEYCTSPYVEYCTMRMCFKLHMLHNVQNSTIELLLCIVRSLSIGMLPLAVICF